MDVGDVFDSPFCLQTLLKYLAKVSIRTAPWLHNNLAYKIMFDRPLYQMPTNEFLFDLIVNNDYQLFKARCVRLITPSYCKANDVNLRMNGEQK